MVYQSCSASPECEVLADFINNKLVVAQNAMVFEDVTFEHKRDKEGCYYIVGIKAYGVKTHAQLCFEDGRVSFCESSEHDMNTIAEQIEHLATSQTATEICRIILATKEELAPISELKKLMEYVLSEVPHSKMQYGYSSHEASASGHCGNGDSMRSYYNFTIKYGKVHIERACRKLAVVELADPEAHIRIGNLVKYGTKIHLRPGQFKMRLLEQLSKTHANTLWKERDKTLEEIFRGMA